MKRHFILIGTLLVTLLIFSQNKTTKVSMTETLEQPRYDLPIVHTNKKDKERKIPSEHSIFETNQLPPGDVYYFQCVQNRKVVEVEDGIGEKGRKVQQFFQYERNGIVDGKNQQWLIIPVGNRGTTPTYFIINNGFLNYLSATGMIETIQSPTDDKSLWQFEPTGAANTYYIKQFARREYLQIPSGNNENGTRLTIAPFSGQPNQQFQFIRYSGTTGPSNYRNESFVNIVPALNNSKTIQVANASTANSAPIQLFDIVNGAQNEHWRLIRTPDGYYNLKPRHAANKCADIADFLGARNTRVLSWDCSPVEKQKWIIIPVVREPGNHIIFNKVSGRCLDIANASSANGTNIQLHEFLNQNNQKWKFLPAR